MSNKNTSGSFFYTLLGYLAILAILALIAFLIGAVMYWSNFNRLLVSASRDTIVKWVGFILYTPVTFWIVIKGSRQRWRNNVFWWTTASLLFTHVVFFLTIFRYVEHWNLLYWVVILMIEGPVISIVSNWTFERFSKKHHSRGGAAHP
jgi:hypothetical protein